VGNEKGKCSSKVSSKNRSIKMSSSRNWLAMYFSSRKDKPDTSINDAEITIDLSHLKSKK